MFIIVNFFNNKVITTLWLAEYIQEKKVKIREETCPKILGRHRVYLEALSIAIKSEPWLETESGASGVIKRVDKRSSISVK